MADSKARIVISAKDDTAAGIATARANFARLNGGLDDVERRFARIGRSSTGFGGMLRGAFAGLSVGLVAQQFVSLADTFTNTEARLRLVTSSTQEFTEAQRVLFKVAQDTRTGFAATVDLFASLRRSTEQLGVSQSDVLGVTEAINQALVVSGANAESAAAAITQLGQGFASGVLRGEELNSVLEQAPRLARAIADGLGVTVGQLRAMGKEGELTADRVFGALQKSAGSIRREFDQMPVTVGQATTRAANAVLQLAGAIDKATGSTSGLAGAISAAAASMEALAGKVGKGGFLSLFGFDRAFFAKKQLAELASGVTSVTREVETLQQILRADPTNADAPRLREKLRVLQAELEVRKQLFREADKQSKLLPPTGAGGGRGTVNPPTVDLTKLNGAAVLSERVTKLLDATPSAALAKRRDDIKALQEALNSGAITAKQFSEAVAALDKKGSPKASKREFEDYARSISQSLTQMIEESDLVKLGKLNDQLAKLDELAAAGLDPRIVADVRAMLLPAAHEFGPEIPPELLRDAEKLRELLSATPTGQLDDARSTMVLLARAFEDGQISAAQFSEAAQTALGTAGDEAERLNSMLSAAPTAVLERQRSDMQLLAQAFERGAITAAQFSDAAAAALGNLPKETESALSAMDEFSKQAARNIQDTLGDSVKTALRGDFDSIGDMWANLLIDMAAQAIAADLGRLLLGDFGRTGVVGGVFGGLLGSFGGAFANGGTLGAGRWGIAGEAGPEIIKGPAEVVPMNRLGGGNTYVYSPTVTAGVTRNELASALAIAQQQMRGEMHMMFRRVGLN